MIGLLVFFPTIPLHCVCVVYNLMCKIFYILRCVKVILEPLFQTTVVATFGLGILERIFVVSVYNCFGVSELNFDHSMQCEKVMVCNFLKLSFI